MNKTLAKRTTDLAMAICPLNLERRTSHIAFLVKQGKIVRIGLNSAKSHPSSLYHGYKDYQHTGLHAELNVCLKSGKENLKKYKMVVIRVNRNNQLENSKPCPGCQSVIKQFNVGEVWYSNSEGNFVKLNNE